jgi:hypothetical protein
MGWWNRLNIRLIEKRIAVIGNSIAVLSNPLRVDTTDDGVSCALDLSDRLEVKRLEIVRRDLAYDLKQRVQREMVEICRRVGCDMQSVGGCNAGCCDTCACSVPVHTCTRCGACDYGENEEAHETRRQCGIRYGNDEIAA